LRAPPDFREELHPEEIVRRPSRHPWLATLALVVSAIAIGLLLRALAPLGAEAPAAANRPGAVDRGERPGAHAAGANDGRTAARSDR
jgi:hypothetical protein